ncbi:hypothetical protein ACHAXM_006240 [Skeletonema potamos]
MKGTNSTQFPTLKKIPILFSKYTAAVQHLAIAVLATPLIGDWASGGGGETKAFFSSNPAI